MTKTNLTRKSATLRTRLVDYQASFELRLCFGMRPGSGSRRHRPTARTGMSISGERCTRANQRRSFSNAFLGCVRASCRWQRPPPTLRLRRCWIAAPCSPSGSSPARRARRLTPRRHFHRRRAACRALLKLCAQRWAVRTTRRRRAPPPQRDSSLPLDERVAACLRSVLTHPGAHIGWRAGLRWR